MPPLKALLETIPLSKGALAALLALPLLLIIMYQMNAPSPAEYPGERDQISDHERHKKVADSLSTLRIQDTGLLRCIEETAADRANLPANTPGSIVDVRELEMLYCRDRNITSLQGLEQLRNLRYLDVSKNGVRSLAALAGHPRLSTLHVSGNPLSSIRGIKSLPALKKLYLPDLRDTECLDIARQVAGLTTNYSSIACAGPKSADKTSNTNNYDKKSTSLEHSDEDDTLSDSQQRELLEFEREMRYSK